MNNRMARRAWAAARRKHIKRGRLYHAEIQHDATCMIFSPARVCTCNPTRILKDDRGRILARVEGAGEYDPFELVEVRA
jgi:hypothetical protein